ncbi:MAG TPA: hypothetical protein VGP61_00085, partial [Gemmatimonadales bacterium]|nr:hypothetical protein [Gemmatimonadales bacterium]
FVAGVTGEQFALPEAVVQLRATRRESGSGTLVALSAADPLNLVGIVIPGERIPALTRNRIVFRDGIPLAVREAGEVRFLEEQNGTEREAVLAALTRRPLSPKLRIYLGMTAVAVSGER